jgi:hypothetical protein
MWVAGGTSGICKSQSSWFGNPVAVGTYTNGMNVSQLAFDGANVWASGGSQIGKF